MKTLCKKVKLLNMSNFTFLHNVFYVISILKSFISHISVVVCSFFEFGMVSKWCSREWDNPLHHKTDFYWPLKRNPEKTLWKSFSLFPMIFSILSKKNCIILAKVEILHANAYNLDISKVFAISKLKAFASGNLNVTQMIEFVFWRVRNIVEKRENINFQ